MKILGETKTGYLCELSRTDMQAIWGARYGWSEEVCRELQRHGIESKRDYSSWQPQFVGAEIQIAARFQRLTEIERQHAAMKNTGQALRVLADLLDRLGDDIIIPAPKTED